MGRAARVRVTLFILMGATAVAGCAEDDKGTAASDGMTVGAIEDNGVADGLDADAAGTEAGSAGDGQATAGSTDSAAAGTPDSGTAGVTDEGTAGTPDEGTGGVSGEGTAGTPDEGTAGVTDEGTAGVTDEGTAGVTDEGTAGVTDEGTAGTMDGTGGSTGSDTMSEGDASTTAPSFASVAALLEMRCASCHSGGTLNFRQESVYETLTSSPTGACASAADARIVVSDAENSLLIEKIEGRASCGSPMPLGGPALPEEEITLLRDWIDAGAPQE